MMLTGAGVGLLTGFLGVGGGFLIVPALVMLVGLPMREAVGTSLLVIAMNSLAGLLGHLRGRRWTSGSHDLCHGRHRRNLGRHAARAARAARAPAHPSPCL